ncbi:unnamed protein product [Nezara viridula]|uniref:Uncharacterized protein n=1 Tax=Nezara viridula TaxID=85310 RepID=A0A9P0GZ80_NEZVI|nr:unnamed protein product [Nezara viridula]
MRTPFNVGALFNVDFSLEDKEGCVRTSSLDGDVLWALVKENPRTTVREVAGKHNLANRPLVTTSRQKLWKESKVHLKCTWFAQQDFLILVLSDKDYLLRASIALGSFTE